MGISIGDVFGAGGVAGLVDDILKMFPNAQQQAEAQLKLIELVRQSQQAQTDINKAEAASGNLFLAGWRPFIGWICGIGFLYSVIQAPLHLPAYDTSTMLNVLFALLGIGSMRTVEKGLGVATKAIKGLIK